MERELRGRVEQTRQSREMRHVTDEREIARVGRELVAHPLGRIFGLQSADHPERRKRGTSTEDGFTRLAGAKLAAVPDLHGHESGAFDTRCCFRRLRVAARGKRALRIDVRSNRVGVVDENNTHDIV